MTTYAFTMIFSYLSLRIETCGASGHYELCLSLQGYLLEYRDTLLIHDVL